MKTIQTPFFYLKRAVKFRSTMSDLGWTSRIYIIDEATARYYLVVSTRTP